MLSSRPRAALRSSARSSQPTCCRRSFAWVVAVGLLAASAGFATPLGRNSPVPQDLTDRRSVPRVQLGSEPAGPPVARDHAARSVDPGESLRALLIALGGSVRTWKKFSYATTGTSLVLLLLTGWLLVRSTRNSRSHRRHVRIERARRLRESSAREAAESRAASAQAAAVKADSACSELERKMVAARVVVQRQLEARLAAEQEAAQALDSAEREIAAREAAEREVAVARVVAEREVMAREAATRAALDRQEALLKSTRVQAPLLGDIDLAIDEAWSRAVVRPAPSRAARSDAGDGRRKATADRASKHSQRAGRSRPRGATVHQLDAHRVRRGATPAAPVEGSGSGRNVGQVRAPVPKRHRELLRLSRSAAAAGRNEQALELALRAHEVCRTRDCVLHLTRLLAMERRFEIGEAARLRRAVRNYPEEPVFLYAAGVFESMYGSSRKALSLIEAALQREKHPHHRERMMRDYRAIRLDRAAQA